jgi:serine phosphatase RsbU (regulator of sigma subunit)/ligand-binding sensor domain-containing protein
MRFNFKRKILTSALGFLFVFPTLLSGQIYSFFNYGTEKNIPNGFLYTIQQADDGFLWIGTANGLLRFDGYQFFPVQYPDSSETGYPTKSLKDKHGTLWFGCSDGSVLYMKDNKLIKVPVPNTKSISEILEGPDGLVYIIPQGKSIFSVNPLKPGEIHQIGISVEPVLFSGAFSSSGDLLLGTQENLLICTLGKDSVSVKATISDFSSYGITSIFKTGNGFLLGTDGDGLYALKFTNNGHTLDRIPGIDQSLTVQSITGNSDKSVLISTMGSGVVQLDLSENLDKVNSAKYYDINSGLPDNDVRTVFQDIEGNYWFGMYGKGILMLASNSMGYYSPGNNAQSNNILYVKNIDNKYLLGTPTGFHLFDEATGKSISFTSLAGLVGSAEIKSYFLDDDKNLWIGTAGNGLYLRSNSGSVRRFYRSGDTGLDDIKDIEIDSKNIWLATTNGVVVLDRAGNTKEKFDINNSLPHNFINKLLITNGDAYVGTESDKLYRIDSGFRITRGNSGMTGSTRNKILSFSTSEDGAIWVATEGNGVFRFLNDSITSVTRSNDLMSNYCYSILADKEGDIWVGHNKGISRINSASGIIHTLGTELSNLGICNPDGMFESADKKIFIGTTQGLIIYDRNKERNNTVAPFNNINSIEINDVVYSYRPSFVLPYTKYKVKIYYSGINFSSPEKIYYSSYLENFDLDWSKMTPSREALYSLSDGKYKFNLISVNQDGLSQGAPVFFTILIKKPFFRTWWFILCSLSVITAVVLFVIREREKEQKKVQEYLEKELEARTSVVMKQKGEIELQNIEITDSINYAKRIQTSILPDISKLKDSFKDAFIFFHPRDIVSGDFYWFDKVEDDKFILVCADSTGHGVPGAFMSMIGSTLLQDIVTRKGISKPSEILSLLDKQIFSTLNQNVELGVSNDGMDMVVCEFNVSTRHIRFASAMRPVIIVLDGEPVYIKGNRSSVGGESVMEKYFDDQEYYLKEGDTIYLFSDGLPDQFGGTEGKKLKIARLKKLIEQISILPMDQQHAAISKFYFDWKGSYDQVDDVLLMGVKV